VSGRKRISSAFRQIISHSPSLQTAAILPLLLCGGLSGALYLALTLVFPLPKYAAHRQLYDLTSLTHYSAWGAILYALLVVALFGLYWQAWRSLCRAVNGSHIGSQLSLGIVAVYTVLFAFVLVWLYPINAVDLFQYFFRSRIFVFYHNNPFVVTPDQFPADPYLYVVGEWAHISSVYGPAWELLAAGAAWLTRGILTPNLLVLKGISALFYIGSVLLVYLILERIAPQQRISGTLLFAWNPLILLEWIGNGHNDAVMMLLILLGIWLWTRKLHMWVLPALGMAALIKAIAAITLPFFALAIWLSEPRLSARLRWLLFSLILSVLVSMALYAPFGLPWRNINGMLEDTAPYGFSISATLVLILYKCIDVSRARFSPLPMETLRMLRHYAYVVPRWLALAGLTILYVWQLVLVWKRRQDPIIASLEVFFACVVLTPGYRVWYPSWAMALIALRPRWDPFLRVGTACLAAELSGLIYGNWNTLSVLSRHLLGTVFVILLPVLSPKLWRRIGLRL